MPETPTFGFEYETPQSKPGITLTGDIDGSAPILAEQVDSVLSGIDARVAATEGAITALQATNPSDTGWQTLSVAAASGYSLSENVYRRWGPLVAISIILSRTGVDVVANSTGNVIGDPLICTINTTQARTDRQLYVVGRATNTSGAIQLATSGTVNLLDLHSDSRIATDDVLRITCTYFVATFN